MGRKGWLMGSGLNIKWVYKSLCDWEVKWNFVERLRWPKTFIYVRWGPLMVLNWKTILLVQFYIVMFAIIATKFWLPLRRLEANITIKKS